MKAYQGCLGATSTSESPWYVVPAGDKENARLIVSQIVLDALQDSRCHIRKRPRNAGKSCSRSARAWRNRKTQPVVDRVL